VSRASRVKAWAAFVAAWTGIGVAVSMYLEGGESRVLVPVLAGFVVVAALWRPLPRTGTIVSILAAGAFVALRYLVQGTEGIAQPSIAASVTFLGLGIIADSLTSRADADALQRRHDTLLIEELTPTGSTGAMKWQHAQKQLADEVARGRRYKYPVTLVLVGLDKVLENADDATIEHAVRQRSELVRLLLSRTRTSDRVSFRADDQLALVMPHTPVKGALAFLEKNLPEIKVASGMDPRIGVAEFPSDAGLAEELVTEAESALEFGRASGMRVVSRTLLMGEQAQKPPTAPGAARPAVAPPTATASPRPAAPGPAQASTKPAAPTPPAPPPGQTPPPRRA
jgi:GGDEF domain-containing protein